jgi:hypothetical protein
MVNDVALLEVDVDRTTGSYLVDLKLGEAKGKSLRKPRLPRSVPKKKKGKRKSSTSMNKKKNPKLKSKHDLSTS